MFHGAGRFYNLRNPEMKPLIEVCVGRHCCYGLLAPLSGMALRSRLAPWKIIVIRGVFPNLLQLGLISG